MTQTQQQAYDLYVAQNKTQKEIAARLCISAKTLYNWIHRFGWHTERHGQQTMWSAFAHSMGRQLRAYQQGIAEIEDGETPTAADVQLQCKLLNAMLRIAKQGADTADAVPDFLHYVSAMDEQLGQQLVQHYQAYTTVQNVQTTDDNDAEEVATPEPTIKAMPQAQESAPFTEADFKQNQKLVRSLKDVPVSHTSRFRGRFVNSRWLQYNLFQYCLPPQQRSFIGDARKVLDSIDHAALQQQISNHFMQQQYKVAT